MDEDTQDGADDAPGSIVDPRTVPARFHHLKAMSRSGAHAFDAFQASDRDSLAIRLGAGAHAMLFNQPVSVFLGAVRRGKEWDAFKARAGAGVILNAKEHAQASAIANAVRSHPTAARLLFAEGNKFEHTIIWEQNGRARRSTPDCHSPRHVVELKTTRNSDPRSFVYDALRSCYHAQVADQCAAVEFSYGTKVTDAYVVAVENVKPYVVQCYRITSRALEQGARMCRLWLEQLQACEAANFWPGYQQTMADLDLQDGNVELVFGEEGAA